MKVCFHAHQLIEDDCWIVDEWLHKIKQIQLKDQKNNFSNNNFISQHNGLNIFVTIEEIETHRILKSGQKSKYNETF